MCKTSCVSSVSAGVEDTDVTRSSLRVIRKSNDSQMWLWASDSQNISVFLAINFGLYSSIPKSFQVCIILTIKKSNVRCVLEKHHIYFARFNCLDVES